MNMDNTKDIKGKPAKVKDEFLADLIRQFGAEWGVELYQEGSVSKDDLAAFGALLTKFNATVKRKYQPLAPPMATGYAGQRRPIAGTDPS
jgi:hypothetical protein